MENLLYHGTPNGNQICKSGKLLPMSFPEYLFDVEGKVLSLTRSKSFAYMYANMERDGDFSPMVWVINRDILRHRTKLTIARSAIYDDYEFTRSECEEFVQKPIYLTDPCVVDLLKL